MVSFDEGDEPLDSIPRKASTRGPEGHTLLAVRRARNSAHVWEAEYEETEVLQMRCS